MKIKQILTRIRRDLTVVFLCEHCDDEHNGHAYDDDHYHKNVMPDMKCKKCGKSQEVAQEVMQPRYPQNLTV